LVSIIWFRRDLRLSDNEIVALAIAKGSTILPCFIIDPWFYTDWADICKARVRFLFEALENLDHNLRQRGSQLYLFEGNAVTVMQTLTQQLLEQGYRPQLFFNQDVQVTYGIERDQAVLDHYRQLNLACYVGLNFFVQADDEHRDTWHHEYYTYQRQPLHPTPERIPLPSVSLNLPQLTLEELKQKYRTFWQVEQVYFSGGETQAIATLDSFLTHRFRGYHWKLSRPWLAQQRATSHLSPHLAFGTLSTRTVYQRTKARAAELADQPKAQFSLKAFRDRLRWRDSFQQRLIFHPELAYQNRYPEFDSCYQPGPLTPEKQTLFQAWQTGQTGFPLLDASMRQLRHQGWMNFRMRAMCATFLTINCGVSWHHGAQHFMNYLVDGDLAIDNWQWQMQAGITNPLSDIFRIYNPNKNIESKDSELRFLFHWVPELRDYSLPEILAGSYLGKSVYPAPILDWTKTRAENGKRVADLRRQVKARLQAEGGPEYESAIALQETVRRYKSNREQQYQAYRQAQAEEGMS